MAAGLEVTNPKTILTETIHPIGCMKRANTRLQCALLGAALAWTMQSSLFAGTIYMAASGTDLATGTSWTNGVAPGAGDVATWVTGSLGGASTMSTGPTWGGIAMTAATADPVIAAPASGTFTLGSAGHGLRLQMQTNSLSTGLNTNWTYVTDGSVSATNVTVDATKPTTFFRLVYP